MMWFSCDTRDISNRDETSSASVQQGMGTADAASAAKEMILEANAASAGSELMEEAWEYI